MRPVRKAKAAGKAKPKEKLKSSLVGTWKLVSCVFEDIETKERTFLYGEHPNGCAIFTPEGRLMAIITAEGRNVPRTAEDREEAFRSAGAYSGKYRVEGNTFVTKVDISWHEGWVGSDQVRTLRMEGDKMHIETPPTPIPNRGDRMMRGILVWERERK